MITVVGVRFKKAGKIYYFDPDELPIEKDNHVIVETARGIEFGTVVIGKRDVAEEEIVSPLKKVLRIATPEDIESNHLNKERSLETFKVCVEKIKDHGLDMKLIDVEYTFDNNKVIFYFTADGRIDFRELVKDLAAVFKTRIELRQIGVRDEAKMVNGIGPCGVGLCCANWLGDFAPVSIKMAKDQNLSLNPTKISGICGRLMCCLKYEHETYQYLRKNMPNRGDRVMTIDGPALVIDTNILLESVKVRHINSEQNDHMDLGEDILVYRKSELKGVLKRSQQVDADDDYVIENAEDMPPELLAEIQNELRNKKGTIKNGNGKPLAPGGNKRSSKGNHATWKSARTNGEDHENSENSLDRIDEAWEVPSPKHEPVREPREAIKETHVPGSRDHKGGQRDGQRNNRQQNPKKDIPRDRSKDIPKVMPAIEEVVVEGLAEGERKQRNSRPRHRNNKNRGPKNPGQESAGGEKAVSADHREEKPREQQSQGHKHPRHRKGNRPKPNNKPTE